MVLEPIPDPDVEVCSVWTCNPMRHNEDVMSIYEDVCHIPHQIGEKLLDII